MTTVPKSWALLLEQLSERHRQAESMGGQERLQRQAERGRLDVRERIARLCDDDSFAEYGALGGGADPTGRDAIAADGLVGGVATIAERPVVIVGEDFTVKGGSIGHVNSAKRLRLTRLAYEDRLPLVLLLDGAGERADNALERYPYAPSDLQVLADLKGRAPIVALVLGSSAGHGALCGLFADLIVMTEGSSMFAAGPPLVRASLGIDISPQDLGGAEMHTADSGVAHNLVAGEDEAFALARRFLSYLPQCSGESAARVDAGAGPRRLDQILDLIPVDVQRPYDMRAVLSELVDRDSLCEVQPGYGRSMITAFARLGGHPTLILANQPAVYAGAITAEAARKATHFLQVAAAFELPVVFLADNPGVMPGPDAERAGTLREAAAMYAAQRALRGPKLHVTVRKAFGFGSSLMAMNPFDRQCVTIAFPGICLGGVPAVGGAEAARASDEEKERLAAQQSGAWAAADNGSYDRVIDPRDLRNELIRSLALGCSSPLSDG